MEDLLQLEEEVIRRLLERPDVQSSVSLLREGKGEEVTGGGRGWDVPRSLWLDRWSVILLTSLFFLKKKTLEGGQHWCFSDQKQTLGRWREASAKAFGGFIYLEAK